MGGTTPLCAGERSCHRNARTRLRGNRKNFIGGLPSLTTRAPVSRPAAERDSSNARAALEAGFTFAFVDLPESFENLAVRNAVRMFQVDARSRAVGDRISQDIANSSMQTVDSRR